MPRRTFDPTRFGAECSKGSASVSRNDCPSALVRDGKLARLFFFLSSLLLRPKKGRKGPRWWYSIECCAKAAAREGRETVGPYREGAFTSSFSVYGISIDPTVSGPCNPIKTFPFEARTFLHPIK